MQCSTTFTGADLVKELGASDNMEAGSARAWITSKTGREFDPEAMYMFQWSDTEDLPTWSGYLDLQVHIMTDRELLALESEVRRQRRLPQRNPWEASMFQSAMGRSDSQRR